MLLSYVQKAHFKSTHIQKLHLALDVYRGLGTIPAVRLETLAKVTSMLLHPFPKVLSTSFLQEHRLTLTIDSDRGGRDFVGTDPGGRSEAARLELAPKSPEAGS